MATQTPRDQFDRADASDEGDRFEHVDWDALDDGVRDLPASSLATIAAFVGYALFLLYDVFVVASGEPTVSFSFVGVDLVWDVTAVDWLFVLTLFVLLFFGVVPLAQNPRMTAYYWRQFRKNRAAVASLAYLLVVFTVGTVGPLFLTPPELNVLAAYQPPLFTTVDASVPTACVGPVSGEGCRGSWAYPLGTTGQGKDVLQLVVFGMRVSMQVGLVAMLISIAIATAVGTTAAYAGGLVDEALMRYVDIQLTFPTFFLFLLLAYLFGSSLFLLIVIFGVTGWGGIARIIRSEALQRTEEEYIRAAKSAGASGFYVVRRHVIPNVSNSIVTAATLAIPGLILAEAAFAFIGLSDPTVPSWGRVIADGRGDLSTAWWISTIPGLFLFTTILAFNFVGDALRDALDPRQEGE